MSNSNDLKKDNQNQVYRYIYSNEDPVSKYDILEHLGLSLPSINLIMKYLLDRKYVIECGTLDSNGGRPPKAYKINPDLFYSIGLDITYHHANAVIIDLHAGILASERLKLSFTDTDKYYQTLWHMIEGLMDSAGITSGQVLGIGIAIPVMVNVEKQTLIHANTAAFDNVTIETFKRHFDLPCLICNDANAGGLAESWNRNDINDSVYLSLNNTVGGAIFHNNSLYFGDTYESGEIGHVTLIPGGKKCYCGKKGCVNVYTSAQVLSNYTDGNLEQFFQLLNDGDENALRIWDNYQEHLAITVNNLKMIFDCSVIIGGYVGSYLEKYEEDLKKRLIERNTYSEKADYFKICRYKRFATAVGASLLHVSDFLKTV